MTDCLPAHLIEAAVLLVGAVHEEGPEAVDAALRDVDLRALAITLAAMVPDDRTPTELLAWNDDRYVTVPVEVACGGPYEGTDTGYYHHVRGNTTVRPSLPCQACRDAHAACNLAREQRRRAAATHGQLRLVTA